MWEINLRNLKKVNELATKYQFEFAKQGEIYLYFKQGKTPWGVGPIEADGIQSTIRKFESNGFTCYIVSELMAKKIWIKLMRDARFCTEDILQYIRH